MDKLDNIKSVIASATAVDSKKRPGIAASVSHTEKATVRSVSPTTVDPINQPKNKSAVSSKTLTETLERSEERVREAVEEINSELVKLQSEVGFSVDGKGSDVVVTVKRKESGEIVRQIPSEMALQLAANLEKLKGLIVDDFS
ncbi:flagellar protein FlaG [Betaproteobacteria bacterium]|nr:flagellar protein FlaG [Betaproteobacteria bacterium]